MFTEKSFLRMTYEELTLLAHADQMIYPGIVLPIKYRFGCTVVD